MRHRRGRFNGGVHVTNGAVTCRGGGRGGSGWLGMRSSALIFLVFLIVIVAASEVRCL